MNTRKTILNMGLAFSEEKVLKKFSKLASEGWMLKEAKFSKYIFEKSDPDELVFNTDMRVLETESEKEEYIEMFEVGGWNYICSINSIHYFSSKKGNVSMFTDTDTNVEKYLESISICKKAVIITLPIVSISVLLDVLNITKDLNEVILNFQFLITLLSIALLIPSSMTFIGLKLRVKKIISNNK